MATATAALTFEEIDQHIRSVDLSAFQIGGRHHLTADGVRANPSIALPAVCPSYHAIRPILLALEAIPFIPKDWKSTVKAFTGVMDAVCP